MLGNFSYCNPTKLYFGDESLKYLNDELPKYGANVVLIYGGGSIKKNGIYDEVIEILEKNGKNVAEISGVMPNPTVDKLHEGVEIARKHDVDMLLAVGGGSVCDYAKAVSVSAITPKRSLSQSTAGKTRGRSIMCASKSQRARRFPWAAC